MVEFVLDFELVWYVLIRRLFLLAGYEWLRCLKLGGQHAGVEDRSTARIMELDRLEWTGWAGLDWTGWAGLAGLDWLGWTGLVGQRGQELFGGKARRSTGRLSRLAGQGAGRLSSRFMGNNQENAVEWPVDLLFNRLAGRHNRTVGRGAGSMRCWSSVMCKS